MRSNSNGLGVAKQREGGRNVTGVMIRTVFCVGVLVLILIMVLSDHVGAMRTLCGNTKSGATMLTSDGVAEGEVQKKELNESRVRQMSMDNRNMVYLETADILLVTMAKAGTSSLWHWVYRGMTGRERWDNTVCGSYVHQKKSSCWDKHAYYLEALNKSKQIDVLTSNHTLRVAIQRDPYDRLISAYKSKFTCDDSRFSTDVHDRATMVPLLRSQAGLPPPSTNSECMNISEFAIALHRVRSGQGTIKSLDDLDYHIRPQDYFFDEITYDMIIDVSHLSSLAVLQPIIDRLPFKELVADGIPRRHTSGDLILSIPDDAAVLLHQYALESKPGPLKFLSNNTPEPVQSQ